MPTTLLVLLRSRKFLVLLFDTAVSLALYFGGKYIGAPAFDDIKFVIGLLQPVFLMLIYAIAAEDAARSRALAALNGER